MELFSLENVDDVGLVGEASFLQEGANLLAAVLGQRGQVLGWYSVVKGATVALVTDSKKKEPPKRLRSAQAT